MHHLYLFCLVGFYGDCGPVTRNHGFYHNPAAGVAYTGLVDLGKTLGTVCDSPMFVGIYKSIFHSCSALGASNVSAMVDNTTSALK